VKHINLNFPVLACQIVQSNLQMLIKTKGVCYSFSPATLDCPQVTQPEYAMCKAKC